jgi:hypothetical protein
MGAFQIQTRQTRRDFPAASMIGPPRAEHPQIRNSTQAFRRRQQQIDGSFELETAMLHSIGLSQQLRPRVFWVVNHGRGSINLAIATYDQSELARA